MKSITDIALTLIAILTCLAASQASAQTRTVTKDRNYTIFVKSVEVTEKKASGHEWDHNIVFNAPDLRVEVMRRDNKIERRIALLERKEMSHQMRIMSEHSGAEDRLAKMMKDDRFPFGGDDFAFLDEMSDEMFAVQEALLNDPDLLEVKEELSDLRDQIIRSTPIAENTFKAQFGVQMGEPTIDVAVGDTVKLTVWDDDVASHDLVGSKTLRITKAAVERGHFDVTCGKVISLRFTIQPAE